MLRCIILKPSLVKNLVSLASVLLLIVRVGRVPDTFPNSRTLPLEALRQDS